MMIALKTVNILVKIILKNYLNEFVLFVLASDVFINKSLIFLPNVVVTTIKMTKLLVSFTPTYKTNFILP